MRNKLNIYNSITGKKEIFEPLAPPHVGMYVCGPTVYSHVHLGNVRTFMSFDVMIRYLKYSGYSVRYVRNITDVGHLLDDGEDRIAKKAKLDNIEPMEVVQKYANDFHEIMAIFNILPPDIEPSATGHMLEQIQCIDQLIQNKWAYVSNGSVYFDINHYQNQKLNYGVLSKRVLEDMMAQSRHLSGGDDKRNPLDFALWKKADPEHIMKWPTQWSEGFPGWHLECSTMSTKYLGEEFDIHGGGMDLKFPHHECEIAQNKALNGKGGARFWIHTNMLTVNGQKMSKSLGNSFLPRELILGNHPLLTRGYSPMNIRFFMLQSHYGSTLDFSNEALESARKGYLKMRNATRIIKELKWENKFEFDLNTIQIEEINTACDQCVEAMNDDFNTAKTIGHLFTLVKKINAINEGLLRMEEIGKETFEKMKSTFLGFIQDVLGIDEQWDEGTQALLNMVLGEYQEAKKKRDFTKVDALRKALKKQNILIKDLKHKTDWSFE